MSRVFTREMEEQMIRGLQQKGTPKHLLTKVEVQDPKTLGQQAITYDEWIAATALDWKHPRSGRLKRIDKALQEVDKGVTVPKMRELRTAINDWIRSKGVSNWKQSKRNTAENGYIVERLRVWAFAPGLPTPMTKEEAEAFEFMEQARKEVMHRVFTGKHVQLKILSAIMKGASAASNVKTAASEFKETVGRLTRTAKSEVKPSPNLTKGLKALGTGIGAAKYGATHIGDLVHGDILDIKNLDLSGLKMVKDMIPLEEITADFIPFVNIISGAVNVLVKWGKVAKAAHDIYKTENSRYTIELGDPQKAFDGLTKCLKRDRTTKALQASQTTAKFALQTAGTFADFGTATGPAIAAVNAAATLAHKLFLFGREVKEVIKANEILKDEDNLNFKLFEAYPLAGCYMIRCSDLSDIISMSTIQFGNPGWMDDIEDMKKHYIDPMIKHCDRFIKESLFEIPDMPKRNSPEMEKLRKQSAKATKGMDMSGMSIEDTED